MQAAITQYCQQCWSLFPSSTRWLDTWTFQMSGPSPSEHPLWTFLKVWVCMECDNGGVDSSTPMHCHIYSTCSHTHYCFHAGVKAYLKRLGQEPEAAWPAAGGAAALELLVHSAWLVYEEAPVIQDVLRRCGHIDEAITLTFISVTYRNPQSLEEGVHTRHAHPADSVTR